MAAAVPQDRFLTVNGLKLHYLDWGGNSPRVVLLVHGLTGNAHNWDAFAQRICSDYRALALDQRGHGDSDHCRDGYPVTGFASDIYEFSRALGIIPYNFVGHSLGARNGIAYAGDHSQDLERLVLVDFGPEATRQGARNTRVRTGERPLGFRSEQDAVQWFRENNPGRTVEECQHMVRYGLRINWAGRLVWKHDPELFWITGSAGAKEVPYLWDQVRRITCSTLVMRGENSEILAPETVEKMLSLMPRGKSVEVKGAGHAIPQDQPQEFERLVREFLASS